jgi:hypothetical protein
VEHLKRYKNKYYKKGDYVYVAYDNYLPYAKIIDRAGISYNVLIYTIYDDLLDDAWFSEESIIRSLISSEIEEFELKLAVNKYNI